MNKVAELCHDHVYIQCVHMVHVLQTYKNPVYYDHYQILWFKWKVKVISSLDLHIIIEHNYYSSGFDALILQVCSKVACFSSKCILDVMYVGKLTDKDKHECIVLISVPL